jgi:hypothetical protein
MHEKGVGTEHLTLLQVCLHKDFAVLHCRAAIQFAQSIGSRIWNTRDQIRSVQ